MICIYLYNRLAEHATPEILRTPLHELALTIKFLKLGDIGEFLNKAIEPPPLDAVAESVALLKGKLDILKTASSLFISRYGARAQRAYFEKRFGRDKEEAGCVTHE